MKGYLKTIEAKLSQPVNETFYLVPINGANCCYLDHLTSRALAMQCKHVKKSVPTMVGQPPLQ